MYPSLDRLRLGGDKPPAPSADETAGPKGAIDKAAKKAAAAAKPPSAPKQSKAKKAPEEDDVERTADMLYEDEFPWFVERWLTETAPWTKDDYGNFRESAEDYGALRQDFENWKQHSHIGFVQDKDNPTDEQVAARRALNEYWTSEAGSSYKRFCIKTSLKPYPDGFYYVTPETDNYSSNDYRTENRGNVTFNGIHRVPVTKFKISLEYKTALGTTDWDVFKKRGLKTAGLRKKVEEGISNVITLPNGNEVWRTKFDMCTHMEKAYIVWQKARVLTRYGFRQQEERLAQKFFQDYKYKIGNAMFRPPLEFVVPEPQAPAAPAGYVHVSPPGPPPMPPHLPGIETYPQSITPDDAQFLASPFSGKYSYIAKRMRELGYDNDQLLDFVKIVSDLMLNDTAVFKPPERVGSEVMRNVIDDMPFKDVEPKFVELGERVLSYYASRANSLTDEQRHQGRLLAYEDYLGRPVMDKGPHMFTRDFTGMTPDQETEFIHASTRYAQQLRLGKLIQANNGTVGFMNAFHVAKRQFDEAANAAYQSQLDSSGWRSEFSAWEQRKAAYENALIELAKMPEAVRYREAYEKYRNDHLAWQAQKEKAELEAARFNSSIDKDGLVAKRIAQNYAGAMTWVVQPSIESKVAMSEMHFSSNDKVIMGETAQSRLLWFRSFMETKVKEEYTKLFKAGSYPWATDHLKRIGEKAIRVRFSRDEAEAIALMYAVPDLSAPDPDWNNLDKVYLPLTVTGIGLGEGVSTTMFPEGHTEVLRLVPKGYKGMDVDEKAKKLVQYWLWYAQAAPGTSMTLRKKRMDWARIEVCKAGYDPACPPEPDMTPGEFYAQAPLNKYGTAFPGFREGGATGNRWKTLSNPAYDGMDVYVYLKRLEAVHTRDISPEPKPINDAMTMITDSRVRPNTKKVLKDCYEDFMKQIATMGELIQDGMNLTEAEKADIASSSSSKKWQTTANAAYQYTRQQAHFNNPLRTFVVTTSMPAEARAKGNCIMMASLDHYRDSEKDHSDAIMYLRPRVLACRPPSELSSPYLWPQAMEDRHLKNIHRLWQQFAIAPYERMKTEITLVRGVDNDAYLPHNIEHMVKQTTTTPGKVGEWFYFPHFLSCSNRDPEDYWRGRGTTKDFLNKDKTCCIMLITVGPETPMIPVNLGNLSAFESEQEVVLIAGLSLCYLGETSYKYDHLPNTMRVFKYYAKWHKNEAINEEFEKIGRDHAAAKKAAAAAAAAGPASMDTS